MIVLLQFVTQKPPKLLSKQDLFAAAPPPPRPDDVSASYLSRRDGTKQLRRNQTKAPYKGFRALNRVSFIWLSLLFREVKKKKKKKMDKEVRSAQPISERLGKWKGTAKASGETSGYQSFNYSKWLDTCWYTHIISFEKVHHCRYIITFLLSGAKCLTRLVCQSRSPSQSLRQQATLQAACFVAPPPFPSLFLIPSQISEELTDEKDFSCRCASVSLLKTPCFLQRIKTNPK